AVAPGANGLLSAEAVECAEAAFDSARVLLLQLEVPLNAVMRAVDLARERGITIILDPAPAQPVPRSLLGQVDILTPNLHEARTLVGGARNRSAMDAAGPSESGIAGTGAAQAGRDVGLRAPSELAASLLTLGAPCAMVTLGSDGVFVARSEEE